MKIATISVQRPVFATVVSLLLVILGLLALTRLAVRELPEVESPIVSIETTYLGASADVVETKITQVIEERFCRVLAWYDNEWGFSNRMSDTALRMGTLK